MENLLFPFFLVASMLNLASCSSGTAGVGPVLQAQAIPDLKVHEILTYRWAFEPVYNQADLYRFT